jgi:hypothetical protein
MQVSEESYIIHKIIHQLVEQQSLFPDFKITPEVQIEKTFRRDESEFFVLLLKHKRDHIRLYVKIGKEENFRAGTLQATYEYFKDLPMYLAVKPISFFPEWRAIVTEESPGLVLKPLLMSHTHILSMRDTGELQKTVFLCGRWLRDFHQNVKAETEFEMEGITLYVSRRLEILENEGLVGIDLCKSLRRHLEEIEKEHIHSLPSVLLHNDFIPGNILVDGEKICVLDFSWVGRGCSYFDIVAFWMELQRLGETPKYSKKRISLLQKTFLDGYGGISEGSIEFRCFELLYRVNSLDSLWRERQKNGWPQRIILDFEIENQLRWLHKFKKEYGYEFDT